MRVCSGNQFRGELESRRRGGFEQHEAVVREIISDVRERGDLAVLELTERFDQAKLSVDRLLVSAEETGQAYLRVEAGFLEALAVATENIACYHRRQLRASWFEAADDGSILGQRFIPLERMGLYVPGGTAAYPSSVLMNAIPAQVAGVSELLICTPPRVDGSVDPHVLVAADQLGIKAVYKAGGAQAVAAMAFGTETIVAVDKIVGPGNIYVTEAKRQVFGYVDIDMLAGPSEILILADQTANPRFIAADLLSQAEHDQLAQVVLVTPDRELVEYVQVEVARQLAQLARQDIAQSALLQHGRIVLVADLAEGIALANAFAPEHLQLMVAEPWSLLGQVKHAGAVFLGPWSPEPIGDYAAGPSHVLPTGGTARFASGLTVDSFRKSSSLIALARPGFVRIQTAASRLATVEGLLAHANALKVRCEDRELGAQYLLARPGGAGGCFH